MRLFSRFITPPETTRIAACLCLALCTIQTVTAQQDTVDSREWTSVDGKKITASYLGTQAGGVALKLANGKVSVVPLDKISETDRGFVREHPLAYQPGWAEWPTGSSAQMRSPNVKEMPGPTPGTYTYTTEHFRFRSSVNLGGHLIRDLSQVFELTHHLIELSPFGLRATPPDKFFDAELYGTTTEYMKNGGRERTAGIYLLEPRKFLAPLELMGVKPGAAGWRKDVETYDMSTIVHELTHMLTHDMLNSLPLWVNEGYAEYISGIPIENDAFRTSPEKIREGVLNALVRDSQDMAGVGAQRVIGSADRAKLQKETPPVLFTFSRVLTMTNDEWTGKRTVSPPIIRLPGQDGPAARPPVISPFGSRMDARMRLPRLYRTSHLIIYYFVQIEKEQGVAKLRKMLAANDSTRAKYEKYRADHDAYTAKVEEFLKQPGVQQLPNGQVRYPSKLTLPVAPEPPFTDPEEIRMGGIRELLAGDTAENVGNRIQQALEKDLQIQFSFEQ